MGDRLRAVKPFGYVTSQLGLVDSAFHPSGVRKMRTRSIGWEVSKHTTRCTSPVSVVSQYELAGGYTNQRHSVVLRGFRRTYLPVVLSLRMLRC